MGAENEQAAQRAVEKDVEGRVKELSKKGKYDMERAVSLGNAFDGMKTALADAQKALGQVPLKGDEKQKAEAKLRGEIGEALTALHDTIQANQGEAEILVDTTRRELEALGAVAKKGPKSYPKPALWGVLGDPSQFDQWMKELDRNPRSTLEALAGVAQTAVDEANTEIARREGQKAAGVQVAWGNQVVNYFSGSVTENRMKKYDEGN